MIRNLEPRMAFQWWETKWAKNKLRDNIGCCPNDEKPMEKKLRLSLRWCPNDDKPHEQMIKLN